MSGTLLWAIHLHLVLCSVSVMLNGADRTPYTHHRPLLRSIGSPTTAPQGAKDTRFLKLEPHWFGQLGNQIVGIAKAYALGSNQAYLRIKAPPSLRVQLSAGIGPS
jgi:hypothetical protein